MSLKGKNFFTEEIETIKPALKKGKWGKLAAFFGPAYLVSVGYMDPGNWATDLQAGSQFGYQLVWVLVLSNIIALVLQSLSARLGIVRGLDLAQCNRETYPKVLNFFLYLLAEFAIIACDLAEVLGMAIGLNLLLGIPLIFGVIITSLDTLLLLYLQKLGIRKVEAFIIALIIIIGGCFIIELFMAKPEWSAVFKGLSPQIPNHAALYIAIGIIGATVMPHNLYLHSSLVQTRAFNRDAGSIKRALKMNFIDSAIALNIALFINAAILILASAAFFKTGHPEVVALKDAYQMLHYIMDSKWASYLFAIALIAAGQSSTITGTMAGQIIMEGYLNLRINPALRRLITRLLAIIPAIVVILYYGDKDLDALLVFSQVLLSMQLGFAIIPLLFFVSNKEKMGVFSIKIPTKIVAWIMTLLIVCLNVKLVAEQFAIIYEQSSSVYIKSLLIFVCIALLGLLIATFIIPLRKKKYNFKTIHKSNWHESYFPPSIKDYKVIALAFDYSHQDKLILDQVFQIASKATELILIHIVESPATQVIGKQTEDFETIEDRKRLDEYAQIFMAHQYATKSVLGFNKRAQEIARIAQENNAELLLVSSHGHKTLGDVLFGETINELRHLCKIPIFICQ